jgi:8-oxo-dGTP diphosphatase
LLSSIGAAASAFRPESLAVAGIVPVPPASFHAPVPSAPPIAVACAVLEDSSGLVLVAQRPAHKHLGLKWEFPGGKVDAGETPSAALLRELREELGCEAVITRALPVFTHDYGDVRIEMFSFVCHLAPNSPAPHPHEHIALRWVPPAELLSLDLAAADLPVVASYRS